MIKNILWFFDKNEKVKLFVLMINIFIGALLELLGVAIFFPFVQLIMDPDMIITNNALYGLKTGFNIESSKVFLIFMALSIIVVYLVKNIYLFLVQKMLLKFMNKCQEKTAVRLFESYMNKPYSYHLQKNIAIIQKNLGGIAVLYNVITQIIQLITEVVVCIMLTLFLYKTSRSITVIVVGILCICVGAYFFLARKKIDQLGQISQNCSIKLYQWVNQGLGGIKEVKVLERENFFCTAYENNYHKFVNVNLKSQVLSLAPRYVVEAACMTGLLGAVILKMLVGSQEIDTFIPQLTIFAVAAFRLLPSVGKMNGYINGIIFGFPIIKDIYTDMRYMPLNEIRHENSKMKFPIRGNIQIKKISYSYSDSNLTVLNQVSVEIPEGKTVAFIGTSGAGKTTLIDIVLGILPPTQGEILYNGVNIYENLKQWHEKIGYIPQHIYLSDDSIKNNIAFGIPESDIDESRVWLALQKAQINEFINGSPNKLETLVGDRGVRLSGGQRQRIGIARALYHDPSILVLDEATSALDNDTESAVMDAIEQLKGEKTIIIVAHRLTTIKQADSIYEIKDGKIIEKYKEEIFGSK